VFLSKAKTYRTMKQFFLLILSTVVFFAARAEIKVLKQNNSGMMAASSWSPEGLPKTGDILIVGKGTTLVISDNLNLKNLQIDSLTLVVDGILNLAKGVLTLGPKSSIYITSVEAQIIPNGNGNDNRINIGNDEKYESKVGSVHGPIYADETTGTTKGNSLAFKSFDGNVPALIASSALPVTFTSFTVSKSSTNVSVKWSTSEEINADVFHVERSEDGKTWRTVGKVKAVGNSSIVNNYTFTDNAFISNTAYYRIKQVDIDGKFIYTEVKAISNQSNLALASNNVNIVASGNNVVVNFAKEVKGAVVVRLISFGGQVIAQQSYNQPSQQIVFNRTAVNKGNYIVFVSNNLDLTASKKINL
jgi:hypothetical protein